MKNVLKKALLCFGLVFVITNVNATEKHMDVLKSFYYKQEGTITITQSVNINYNPDAKVWATSGYEGNLLGEVSSFSIGERIIDSYNNIVGYKYKINSQLNGNNWYCFVMTWNDGYNNWEYRYYITPLAEVWDPIIVESGNPCVGAPTAVYSISDSYAVAASSISYSWSLQGGGSGASLSGSSSGSTASFSSLTTTSSFAILCNYSITTSVWGTLSKTNLSKTVTPINVMSSYGSFPMDEFVWNGSNSWMGNSTPSVNGSVTYGFSNYASGGSGHYSYDNYFGTTETLSEPVDHNSSYTITGRPANTSFFMRKVTDQYCPNNSGWETFNGKTVAKIIVPIDATASPTSSTTYYGGGATLSCTSTGGRVNKTCVWYKCSTQNGTYTAIDATDASYTATGLTSTTYYKCKIADADHSSGVWSNVVTVNVRSKLAIGSITGATTTYSNNNVTLSVGAASGGNNSSYSYQWQVSANGTSGWTNAGTGTSITVKESGLTRYYKVTVTDYDNQTATAGPVSVTWRSPLAIGSISGATTTYSNNSVTLSVGAASGGNNSSYSYQWQVSANGTSGWTNAGTGTSITVKESGLTRYYKVTVTDYDNQTATAGPVSITWRSPLAIGSISGATTTYSNSNVTLSVGAASGGNNSSYTYQWYEYNGSSWSTVGTNSTSYTAKGSGQTKKYYVIVTDKDNQTATANEVSVTWRSPLAIGSISGATTTYSNNSVTLSVGAASGGNNSSYTYQWQVSANGTSGWTNAGTGTSITVSGSGQTKYYQVTVTDGDSQTATAGPVSVSWHAPLVAGSIAGGGVTTYSDNNVELSVDATSGGSGIYTYQWQVSFDGSSGWSNAGTGASIIVSGSGQTKYYQVTVTDDENQTATTGTVSVAWRTPLMAGSISGGGVTVHGGNSVDLTVSMASGGTGAGTYSYQWQVSANGNNEWSNISTGMSVSVSGSGQKKYYRVVVTDGDNQTANTVVVSVTWSEPLSAGNISGGNVTTHSGANVILTANSSGGDGSYLYQWYQSLDGGSNWYVVEGASDKDYIANGSGQTIFYKVTISSDGQIVEPTPVSVTWRTALSAGSINGHGEYKWSTFVTLITTPSGGDGSYSYQWQESATGSSWIDIPGATNQSYSMIGENQTIYYRVVVNGDSQSSASEPVAVTWRPKLIVGTISGITTTRSGGTVALSAVATGGNGCYLYQWEEKEGDYWADIPGATSNSCSVMQENTTGADLNKLYRLKVSGDGQTNYSSIAIVTWHPVLSAGIITGGCTTYSGDNVTLTSTPSGGDGNYTYQWQVSENNSDWTEIPGAVFQQLIETGENGTNAPVTMYYRALVFSEGQSDLSGVAEVTRRPLLKISNIQSVGNRTVYSSENVNLAVEAIGGNGTYNYQWYRKATGGSWVKVGDNQPILTDNHVNSTDNTISYSYKVTVSGDSQKVTSSDIQGNWLAVMRVDKLSYTKETLCYGANTTINVKMVGGSGIYSYQWQILKNNEWQNINDTDVSALEIVNIIQNAELRCVVTDRLYPAHIVTSGVAQITVYPDLKPGVSADNTYVVDNNAPITIGGTAPSGGNGTYHYRWEMSTAGDNGVFVPIDDTTATIDVLPNSNTVYRRYDISLDQDKLAFEIQVDVPLVSGSITTKKLAEFYYAGQQLPLLKNENDASGGNVGGSASYQWFWKKEGDDEFTPIEGATEADYQPTGLTETTMFYRAIIDGDNVQNSNIIELNIRKVDIELANLKERYCKGDEVKVSVSGIDGGKYKWFDADGKQQIAKGATLNLKSIDSSTTLKLKAYNRSGEFLVEKNVVLSVVEMEPDFVADLIIVDAGGVVHFSNKGNNYTRCEWDFGDGADGSYESNPRHYYNSGGVFDVRMRLVSSEGCVAEITKNRFITVNEAVFTDVESDSASIISVYPNPVSDWLTVETNGESEVFIVNIMGGVMFKTEVFTTGRIDVSDYPNGDYIIMVVGVNGDKHYERIVKY